MFASAAVFGLFGAVTGLVTKLVVDALSSGNPGRAMGIGVVYLVLVAVAGLVDDVAALLQSDLAERTSQAVEQKLMEVSSAAAGLEHLERPEYADKVKLVRDRSYLPYFAFTNLNGFSSIVFGLAAAVVLLGVVHPRPDPAARGRGAGRGPPVPQLPQALRPPRPHRARRAPGQALPGAGHRAGGGQGNPPLRPRPPPHRAPPRPHRRLQRDALP